MTVTLPKPKDSAEGHLNAGINASVLSIPLQSGEGASFPQPYTGSASSTGSRTVLNDTGHLANAAIGDFIRNVTDGSWALVTGTGTNSITTTRLEGGSDNTWQSGDVWRVNEFVVTIAVVDADGNDTAYEEALVSNRSTDTLTVPTGGRGYNGTVAQSFSAGDRVQLRVTSSYQEELRKLIKEMKVPLDTATTDIVTLQADMDNAQSNASFYVAAGGSSNAFTGTLTDLPAAYTTGERFTFKANHTISGASTFNRASLGAKTIKKRTTSGLSDLSSGDIQNGDLVEIMYDGTYYQVMSIHANVATLTGREQTTRKISSSDTDNVSNTITETAFTQTCPLSAGYFTAGKGLRLKLYFDALGVAASGGRTLAIKVKLGSTVIATYSAVIDNSRWDLIIEGEVLCRTAGASGAFNINGEYNRAGSITFWDTSPMAETTLDTTASQNITVTATWSVANASDYCKFRMMIVEDLPPA